MAGMVTVSVAVPPLSIEEALTEVVGTKVAGMFT